MDVHPDATDGVNTEQRRSRDATMSENIRLCRYDALTATSEAAVRRPTYISIEPSGRQRDRAFGAVLLGVRGPRLEVTGDVLDEHDRVPNLVGIKDVGRQCVAAPVPLAALCVDTDTTHVGTGNVNGSNSTDLSAAVYVSSVPGLIS